LACARSSRGVESITERAPTMCYILIQCPGHVWQIFIFSMWCTSPACGAHLQRAGFISSARGSSPACGVAPTRSCISAGPAVYQDFNPPWYYIQDPELVWRHRPRNDYLYWVGLQAAPFVPFLQVRAHFQWLRAHFQCARCEHTFSEHTFSERREWAHFQWAQCEHTFSDCWTRFCDVCILSDCWTRTFCGLCIPLDRKGKGIVVCHVCVCVCVCVCARARTHMLEYSLCIIRALDRSSRASRPCNPCTEVVGV
jgi:hypothetical protein